MASTQQKPAIFDDVTDEQVESFRRDGFLIIEEGLVSMPAVEVLRERFAALFDGDYATGIAPDEVNWKRGRDRDDVTRQICNGWRADDLIAAQVLSERTGRIAARLGGYRGTRMLQDNCLWKPPGTKSLGMHQDGSYAGYLVAARDDHLLGRARRDLRPGRHDRVRARLAPVAEDAAGPRQLPRARRLAGPARQGALPRESRSSACRWW